jgi:outer membrane protein OmpU
MPKMSRMVPAKPLLGSTALAVGGLTATPAMAADPIRLGVSGYYQFYALNGAIEGSYALNGTSLQYKGLQFIQNGEIFFTGQTKLDNGTSIGIRVELEGWNPPITSATGAVGANRTIDKAYLLAVGDWGRMEFGAKDDAAYIMYYGAPSALLGFGFFKHNTDFSWTNPTANGFNMAAFRISASTIDAEYGSVNRINYYTPRFAGLQVGLSYAPKIQPKTQPGSISAQAPGPGKAGGICGFSDATTANGCPTNDNSWQDAVAIGANYLNKFGDVSIAVFGAYSYMSFVPGLAPVASAANIVNGANLTSWKQAVVGLQLGYAGFTVGGSFGWENNGIGSNYYSGGDNDTRTWAASVMYETGPWQMSAGFVIATNDNGNGVPSIVDCKQGTTSSCNVAVAATSTAYFGSDPNAGAANFGKVTASKIEVGANYVLGPGVRIVAGAIFNTLSGPSNAVAGQSWAALLGMDLHF